MKLIVAFVWMFCATVAWSAEPPLASPFAVVRGEVLEVRNVESYSYLRLKTADGEVWAAVGRAPVKPGAKVAIENATVMNNFESKALKRTFDKIVFGSLGGAAVAGAGTALAAAHPVGAPRGDPVSDVKVAKAGGADGRTVAEVITRRTELKDKTVLIRGRVVKFSASIMGKNWIHLRDGSGSAIDNSNDVLVTTLDQASVGDIVLVKGIVRTDKDFGSGYAYKVLIEEATLQK
ncbi:MAG: nucleotide-binding protein [Sulfuritalea sp.]|nr:nucleotide-binding protein [Sulfuritalea sp.]